MTATAGETAGMGGGGETRSDWRGHAWRRGHACGVGMKPLELVAMILGFIVFWPIGLAVLAFKFWQRKTGYAGDLADFAQERWRRGFAPGAPAWSRSGGYRRTGNRAFDAWKVTELERLEEERRKLETAQREFADYLDHLRQARDRDEFDRFKNERDAARARGEQGWKPFDTGEPRKGA